MMSFEQPPENDPGQSNRPVVVITAVLLILVIAAFIWLPPLKGLKNELGMLGGGKSTSNSVQNGVGQRVAPKPGANSTPGAPVKTPRSIAQVPGAVPPTGACWAYTSAGSSSAIQRSAQALAVSPCSGNSWILRWRDLEPGLGQYNWSLVDAAISASKNKPVFLRVIAGIFSPTWVKSVARTVTLPPGTYTPSGWMPVPWDRGFLNAWETFIAAYGARYEGNPHVALIESAGTGIYGESYLPGGLALWNSVGYTQAGYVAAIKEIVGKYVAAFPHTFVGLNVSLGVAGANQNVMMPLVTWASRTYPTKVYVQQNGLSGTSLPGQQIVTRAPLFGLQMVGPTFQSRTGSLCQAFRTAIMDRASYVEVYYSDASNPAFYGALRYLNTGLLSATC
jgi:hypothetical protein